MLWQKQTRYSSLPYGCPIVAGLVGLYEEHILRYFLLREVCMECCGSILEGKFISPGERSMERMEIEKGFTEERVSNSLKNENVGLKDIQGWGETMKKDKEAWKCLMSLMEAITELFWISCLKLVDGSTLLPLKVSCFSTYNSLTWPLRPF